MSNNEFLNTTPLKAQHTGTEAKKHFFSLGTIEHIDVTKNPAIVNVVEQMANMAFSSPRPHPRRRHLRPHAQGKRLRHHPVRSPAR